MESQADTTSIAAVVAKMRPADRLPLLLPAYAVFDRLLGDLLLRGSTDVDADIGRFLVELSSSEIQACATTYVYEHELGYIVAAVARYGPGPVDADVVERLWPAAESGRGRSCRPDGAACSGGPPSAGAGSWR